MLFKAGVIASSSFYIYSELVLQYRNFGKPDIISFDAYFFSALFLVFLNWSIEAWKWKSLLKDENQLDFFQSLKSVLTGLAMGLFTPNRLGEPAGRVLSMQENRKKAAVKASVGAFSQLIITLFFGVVGLLFLWDKLFPAYALGINWVAIVCSLFIFLAFLLYYNLKGPVRFFRKILLKLSKGRVKLPQQTFSNRNLTAWLIISAMRYGVFSIQFFLMLMAFGARPDITSGFAAIGTVFLINTAVPSTTLVQLGVRSSAAVFCFTALGVSSAHVLPAVLALWMVNVLIPSIFGLFFLREVSLIRVFRPEK